MLTSGGVGLSSLALLQPVMVRVDAGRDDGM